MEGFVLVTPKGQSDKRTCQNVLHSLFFKNLRRENTKIQLESSDIKWFIDRHYNFTLGKVIARGNSRLTFKIAFICQPNSDQRILMVHNLRINLRGTLTLFVLPCSKLKGASDT